jgi:hypothetical protein
LNPEWTQINTDGDLGLRREAPLQAGAAAQHNSITIICERVRKSGLPHSAAFARTGQVLFPTVNARPKVPSPLRSAGTVQDAVVAAGRMPAATFLSVSIGVHPWLNCFHHEF